MMSSNIIPINVSVSGWYLANYFFPRNAMVSFNIFLINVNFVTVPEIKSGSAKINKKFHERIPETSLKYKLGLLISCNTFFDIALVFHCIKEAVSRILCFIHLLL